MNTQSAVFFRSKAVLILALVSFSPAATVQLSGKLVDRLDKPLNACDVSIEGNPLITKSSPEGSFEISGNITAATRIKNITGISSRISGLDLKIHSPNENRPFKIEFFSLSGSPLGDPILLTLSQGDHALNLKQKFPNPQSSSILILRVSSEGYSRVHKYSFQLPFFEKSSRIENSSSFAASFLAKASAEPPVTVIINCMGLPTKKITVTAYQSNLGNIKVMKPNIVIVLADDLTRHDLKIYGGINDVKTPNLDAFTAQGLKFKKAFTATAMCSPTRQQLYTGLYPVRNGAYPNHSMVYPGTKSVAHYMDALGYRTGLFGKTDFDPPASYPFDVIGGTAGDFKELDSFMMADKAQPYVAFMCSNAPHAPWDQGNANAYNPSTFKLPKYIGDTPETRAALSRYFAEITELDRELGRVLALVNKTGLMENTLVIFTTEQGSAFPFAKWGTYDLGLNVGLVARWPENIKPSDSTEAMVNYVDIVPTLIDAAGGKANALLDGKSFLRVLHGETQEHNQVAYGVHTQAGTAGAPKTGYPIRSIRTKTHKLILNLNSVETYSNNVTANNEGEFWNSWLTAAKSNQGINALVSRFLNRPPEEFYDIVVDPFEQNNLIKNAESKILVDSLRIELLSWMKSQNDKGLETEALAGTRKP